MCETFYSSYDYDAPLSESGQYTAKYNATREMIASYDPLYDILRFSRAPYCQMIVLSAL